MFPEAKRVEYENCPLVQVICQLRFPTMLSIQTNPPAAFQEKVRSAFPIYLLHEEEQKNIEITETESGESELHAKSEKIPNHLFCSGDRTHQIDLTPNYIAFTMNEGSYRTWELFKNIYNQVLADFNEIYKPSFFSRIGLRYIDVIDREKLGLAGVSWSQLITPALAGALSSDLLQEEEISNARQQIELDLKDNRSMLINTGLGTNNETQDAVFIIDSDAAVTSPIESANVSLDAIDALHAESRKFFSWAVTPTLAESMSPKEMP